MEYDKSGWRRHYNILNADRAPLRHFYLELQHTKPQTNNKHVLLSL